MDAIEERLPPHDLEAEQAVLGSILVDQGALYEVSELLTPASFYRAAHRWVYEAILALHGRQESLDVVSLAAELRQADRLADVGDYEALINLLNAVPTAINADTYAGIVAEKAARRRLITAAGSIAKAAYDESRPIADVLTASETAVFEANTGVTVSTVEPARRYMSTYVSDFMADVAATADEAAARVVRTGILDLDRMLGGLEMSHQYLLAGRTSMGKSSLALGIVLNAVLKQGKRVMVFSLEMSQEQLGNRLVSLITNIPVQRLKAAHRRQLSVAEQSAVMEASGRLSEAPLFLDCSPGIRSGDVRSRAMRVYAEHGLDLIVVDHMHIMAPDAPSGNQVTDLGHISMELATTYKRLGVVGLTLAQLNRGVDQRALKLPALSDLRESGRIEENAYGVLFIHRDHYYDSMANPNLAQIIVAKNRDGATGSVDLFWRPETASFGNIAHPAPAPARPNGKANGAYQH